MSRPGREHELGRVRRLVPYGPHPDQAVELSLPRGVAPPGGWPVVVLLHGGFWRQAYGRDLMGPLADDLVDRGVLAWNVEYRRVRGAGGWPATFEDVAAAIDHLALLTAELPIDLQRVVVVGHSAGGHLALWLAGRAGRPVDAPGGPPGVHPAMVVGQAPVASLVAADRLGLSDGAVRELLGGGPLDVPRRWRVADPLRWVGHGVPVVLVHGPDDEVVPVSLADDYAVAALAAGDEVEVVRTDGDHMAVIDPRHAAWEAILQRLAPILDRPGPTGALVGPHPR